MEKVSPLELTVRFEDFGRKQHALIACSAVTFDTETQKVGLTGSSFHQINVPTAFVYNGTSDKWDGNYRVIIDFSCVKPPIPVDQYVGQVRKVLADWGELT